MTMRAHRALAAPAAILLAAALAACTSPTAEEGGGDDPADAVAEAADIAGQELTVAVQSAWPPIGFLEGDELRGVAIDIAAELAERLDVTFSFEKPAFADMIPGVQSGRYEFGLWGADVTADRLQVVDQVAWMKSGYYVQAPVGSGIEAGDDLQGLCGLSIALVQGQTMLSVLEEASAECEASGADPITLLTFADQPSSDLAVESGRADADTVGSQTFGYTSAMSDDWETVSGLLNPVYNGMVFPKGSEIAPIIEGALDEIIADGTYAEILETWNVPDSAIPDAVLDPDPQVG